MRVAIVGLGYVGTVTSACLAEAGHTVVGIDLSPAKVDPINAGLSPISELGLDELVRANARRGRLSATQDLGGGIDGADVIIVCVGTPTGRNGDVHLDDVLNVVKGIGTFLSTSDAWQLVLITSTVPPGTVEGLVRPLLEQTSGKSSGKDFGLAFSPEFLREGSAVEDYMHPERTVIGADDERAANLVRALVNPDPASISVTSIRVAECVKFAANAWHALKVTFANEMGRFCEIAGADSQEVMSIFKADTRLNVSPAYLSPGFAFGGSCLPKDVRTLTYRARAAGIKLPVLESVLPSNRVHLELAIEKILATGARNIAILGLAFKSGTDDLRESPALDLAEHLLGKGCSIKIHDHYVNLSDLIGSNRDYVLQHLPHIADLLHDDLQEAIAGADLVVVAQGNRQYAALVDVVKPGQQILDLSGSARPLQPRDNYVGLLW